MTEPKRKYLLKGDISGIQEFIFNVQSKGAAKSLKARSYYVQIISDLCFKYCCNRLKIAEIIVVPIFSGGGNFFIQIEGENINNEIHNLQNILETELLHDDISIVLTLEGLGESNFGGSWLALLRKSNGRKLKQHKKNYAVFEPYTPQEIVLKKIQERFPTYESGEKHNDLYREIVDRMVKSKVIETVFLEEQFSECMIDFEERLANKLPFWKDYDKLEDYKEYRERSYEEVRWLRDDQSLIDFDAFGDFAAHRTGTNRIAILKMDIDNLGLIFRDFVHSLEDAQQLSNRFKEFFDKNLFQTWENKEFKTNIYPIFVGGDDCFIVGSWDKVLPFAKVVNDAFQKQFKNYTLSAGIVIVDVKHPVVSFAELAENALSDAKKKKNYSESLTKAENHNKNCISIFNEVFSWTEFDKVLEVVNSVTPYLENGQIKRSVLEKIKNSANGFQALQQQILKDTQLDIPKLWRLKYYLGKKANTKGFESIEECLFKPYETALYSALLKKEGINPAVFPVAARIIEFSTKIKLKYAGNN